MNAPQPGISAGDGHRARQLMADADERRRRRESRLTAALADQVADQVTARLAAAALPQTEQAAAPRPAAPPAPPPAAPAAPAAVEASSQPAPELEGEPVDDADADPRAMDSLVVSLDREAYERLVAAAQAPQGAAEELARTRLEQTVDAAIHDGRIPPARRESWIKAIKADPSQADALAALDKGLIPLKEIGYAGNGPDAAAEDDGWFPHHHSITRR